jgi:hypothetical protein
MSPLRSLIKMHLPFSSYKAKPVLFHFFFLVFTLNSFSQQNKNTYYDSIFNKYATTSNPGKTIFYILKTGSAGNFNSCSYITMRVLSPQVYIVKISDTAFLKGAYSCTGKIAPANNTWKLSPSLEEKTDRFFHKKTVSTFTITSGDIIALLASWNKKKLNIKIAQVHKEANAAVIACGAGYFQAYLLPDTALYFADIYIKPQTEIQLIGYNRSVNAINLAQHIIPGATGSGITIGIKEKKMDEADIDLQKRIQPSAIAGTETDNHATVIASLAGGAGNSFYTGKGLAWKSRFYPSSYATLFPDDGNLLVQNSVSVQNHSYGTIIQNFYGAEGAAYDAQTWQHKNILHIFSSGNKGQESSTQGQYANIPGFANLTGNFKMAKNIITVAATDTGLAVAPFSSAGPLYDGRIAPQIAALGPNGTSDAAAIVSGAVALLQQVYKDSNNNIVPPASLMKAALFNSADDVGNKGIDHHSGFGAVNVFNAVKIIQQRRYDGNTLAQNENWIKNITVPARAANLKITLCWTDTASPVNNNKALVNDLDIELIEIATGSIYKPWQLSTFAAADSLQMLPIRKRDSLNTAEQISIDFPAAGQYQIRVAARQVQTIAKQEFNIVCTWDTLNTFQFTNPVNANDINRNENEVLTIKWRTAVADTNTTGTLHISYNNGATWQLLTPAIKLFRQKFNWLIPDTSTTARLRMEGAAGTFYSPDFIIAPVTSLQVEFLCTDSMQLSWNKHAYAGSYQVYTLTDSAYLKSYVTTADTTVIIRRTAITGNVYAVQPLLSNNLPATRSAAIDVRNQGVNCFYKTLLAENRGDKVELILELSTINKTDSFLFEKININGSNTRPLQKNSPVTGQSVYRAVDAAPAAGSNYYRVRIWLKNGGSIYTEPVSVIYNGDQFIFLYPNPVSSKQPINYQLKNITDGLSFQLLDITGRVIKTQPIGYAGKIETTGLPAGFYFCRLVKTDGTIIDAGKVVITR